MDDKLGKIVDSREITREMFNEYERKQMEECAREIQMVLDKYGFFLDVTRPEIRIIRR